MTIGFGTANICWVPEGQPLRFIDLHRWADWRLDLAHWRVSLTPTGLSQLQERAETGLTQCRARFKKNEAVLENIQSAEQFVESLGDSLEQPPEEVVDLALPSGPLASAWIRISDAPLESFFEEDYPPAPEPAESVGRVAIEGALRLPACDELEIPMIESEEHNFALLTPTLDFVGEYPLPLNELPPILDEFCGYQGNSNQGKMVNLRLDSRIAAENPVATPLCRLEPGGGYATLYLYFKTPSDNTVMLPVSPAQARRLEASLAEQSFACVMQRGRNQIWQRDEDWVHCLWDTPGLESEDLPTLQPFVAVAHAHGSREPAAREGLLASILQSALGPVQRRR